MGMTAARPDWGNGEGKQGELVEAGEGKGRCNREDEEDNGGKDRVLSREDFVRWAEEVKSAK